MKILAIVQARSSSQRLPHKVLRQLMGKPMIFRELERLERSQRIEKIVLATSTSSSDDDLAERVMEIGIDVYRGSLDDVLDRFYRCAQRYASEHVVRITGDCPVLDWRIVDAVIDCHLAEQNDYTATSERFPDGLDTEIVRFSSLERAWKEARLPSEREHVMPYIRTHAEHFRIGYLDCEQDFSKMRWTVDELQDFSFIQKVYKELYPMDDDFGMQDILKLLKLNPYLMDINKGFVRNEGLLKSLNEDKKFERG